MAIVKAIKYHTINKYNLNLASLKKLKTINIAVQKNIILKKGLLEVYILKRFIYNSKDVNCQISAPIIMVEH
jgi:hypothetical protein